MRLAARVATCAAAGLAAALSFEPVHWPLLLPVAVAGVTLATVGVRPRRAFWLAAVFGAVFMAVLLPWLRVIGWYAWLPLSVAEGLFYGLAGVATAATARLRWWPVWAATSWVLVEQLRGLVPFGGFPWGRLAFATEDTPVAHWFGFVGAAGVTFLVALLGTTLAWAATRVRRAPGRSLAGVAAVVLLVEAGSWLPAGFLGQTTGGRTVRVALVQGNVPGTGIEAFARQRVVLDNHVQATLDLADRIAAGRAARPDLVVWPENSSDIDPYADPTAAAAIGGAVRAVGAPLLMGAVVGDRGDAGWRNRAIVWSAQGRPGRYYDKIHPVPFGEYIPLRSALAPHIPALDQIPSDMVPGDATGDLQVGPARVGTLMCFEVAYDGLVRNVVRDGAGLVVVPTNNATYTGTGQVAQQFAISRMRAVETGRYVLIASTNGISGIVAPDGHVVTRAPARVQRVLEHTVTLRHGLTGAMRFGSWLELLASAVSVVSVLVGLLVGRRRVRRPQPVPGAVAASSRDPQLEPEAEPQRVPEPSYTEGQA